MDCLETLEEIGQEGEELFKENGGENYRLIPCLNSSEFWVKSSKNLFKDLFLKQKPN